MSKAVYLNWDMCTDEFEEFEYLLDNLDLEGIDIVSCEPYMVTEDMVCYQVTVMMDDIYDYNYGYAQVLEEFGFSYSGHVGA